MSATMEIRGIRDLMEELRKLPAHLAAEGSAQVEAHTKASADKVRDAYPDVSGDLKGGVTHTVRKNRDGAMGRVVSRAPHAFIYETGTASRQTALGYNRGPMPGKKIFIPTMQEERRDLEDDLADILRSVGLQVVKVHDVGPL